MDERPKWLQAVTNDWQRRLTALFTLIFLLPFVSWFASEEAMWWPETVYIVKFTLYVTFAIELLPMRSKWFVRCLQVTAILLLNAWYSDYEPVLNDLHSMKDYGDWVYHNFWQLHPYIWFCLGAWLAYTAAAWWMKVRWRIGFLTVAAVMVLAIRDSFSLLTLWEETAVVIFAGLILLVVRHFSDLKAKNPSGWAYLAEYPGTLLVTVAILLAVTIIPGIAMPGIRPLVTDPYSAYLHWKGEEAPSFGKLLGDIAAISTGDSSSGYSRDDSTLGGGFDYDYSPVFTVDTTHKSYWRGETRSTYTGDGWVMSDGDKQAASGQVTANKDLGRDPRYAGSLLKTVEVRQTVTLLSEEESYPVLFGAYAISKVESINGEDTELGGLRWSPRQMELRWNEENQGEYPKSYSILSQVPVIDEEGLKQASATLPNRNQFNEYLQLPRSLPARVRQLAQDITGSAATPYVKAKLLEKYLQTTYPYTNKPKTELGQSEDFVDRFLFEIKEGYCDYYSSAMAVLSRAAGIPSRWVKGYVSGYNQLQDIGFGQIPIDVLEDPDGAGTYTVRNSDAHSWVELYFPGYGWIPFEPTSGFVLPAAQAEETAPALDLPETDNAAVPEETDTEKSSVWIWVWSAVGAGMLTVFAWTAWFFRGRLKQLSMPAWLLPRKRAADANQKVVLEYGRLMKLYKRRGFAIPEHETAREAIARLKQKDIWLANDLEQLLLLFEKAKYSPRGVTAEESGKASEIVNKLKKAM